MAIYSGFTHEKNDTIVLSPNKMCVRNDQPPPPAVTKLWGEMGRTRLACWMQDGACWTPASWLQDRCNNRLQTKPASWCFWLFAGFFRAASPKKKDCPSKSKLYHHLSSYTIIIKNHHHNQSKSQKCWSCGGHDWTALPWLLWLELLPSKATKRTSTQHARLSSTQLSNRGSSPCTLKTWS